MSLRPGKGAFVVMRALVIVLAFLLQPAFAGAAEGPPLDGDMRKFTPAEPPRPTPPAPFADLEGGTRTLADFKGRVILVNFWATWCAPCIREMPALDRLQAALGGATFQVVLVSEDRRGAEAVAPFLKDLGLKHLSSFLDPRGVLGRGFRLRGLPTTILIDREGKERGRIEGEAAWDGAAARALIEHYLREGAAETGVKRAWLD